ncbi:hypothetical protein [Jiangella endophytica]|uniref:hypothetical protein n=1 Tax=Jiangella endophytica TaxID=1623398 RepID=UPI000E34F5CB|nr:hypothetical protein [Jiangella endophytica]
MSDDQLEDGAHEAIIYDEDGLPVAVADLDRVSTRGMWLAFALAAESGHLERFTPIINDALEGAGDEAQYILTAALHTLGGLLLNDALTIAESAGVDMRGTIRAVRDGEDYPPGGRA